MNLLGFAHQAAPTLKEGSAPPDRSSMRRKMIALVFALVAIGLVTASAASLGGVSSADLGAETAVVASCDTDGVRVTFRTRYAANLGESELRRVIVRGIHDDCIGQFLSVTVTNGTETASRGPWQIVDRGGPSVNFDNNGRGWGIGGADIPASSDFSVAVVITG